MTEPASNNIDVYARIQQVRGSGSPEDVW